MFCSILFCHKKKKICSSCSCFFLWVLSYLSMYFSVISHIAILTIIIMTVGLHIQDWVWSLPHPYRQGEWCPERNWSFSGSGESRCSGLAHPKGCQLIFWLCARTVFLLDPSCSGSCSSVTDSDPQACPTELFLPQALLALLISLAGHLWLWPLTLLFILCLSVAPEARRATSCQLPWSPEPVWARPAPCSFLPREGDQTPSWGAVKSKQWLTFRTCL